MKKNKQTLRNIRPGLSKVQKWKSGKSLSRTSCGIQKTLEKQGFTLVELIIVIAIIAVLAVAAFMMLTKWLGKSRDSRRIGDMATIKKALEVTYSDTDRGLNMYPDPTDVEDVLDGSGVVMWKQGVFGLDTIAEMDNMQKAPKDPGDQSYYKYAITLDKKEFQLGTVLEDGSDVSIVGSVFAADGQARIDGNYDGYVSYPTTGGTMIFKTPSLLVNGEKKIEIFSGSTNKFMLNGEEEGTNIELRSVKTDGNTSAGTVATVLGIDEKSAAIVLKKETGAVVEVVQVEEEIPEEPQVPECVKDSESCSSTTYTSCTDIKGTSDDEGTGTYWIDLGSGPIQAYCDMSTDGGGWTLVLNYLHKGTTNPELSVKTSTLPLMDSTTLGVDESSSSTTWGHTSNAMFDKFNVGEVRFYCKTSNHNRIMHFKTSSSSVKNYFSSGNGSVLGISANTLGGHNAYLPSQITNHFSNQGNYAMTNFTFYKPGLYHWGIKGLSPDQSFDRWECDDYPFNENGQLESLGQAYDTYHQIWIKTIEDCDPTSSTCVTTENKSCKDVLANDSSILNNDGQYWIDPDGPNTGSNPFKVYCDMTTEGGGWTQVVGFKGDALDLSYYDNSNVGWSKMGGSGIYNGTLSYDSSYFSPGYGSVIGDYIRISNGQDRLTWNLPSQNTLYYFVHGAGKTIYSANSDTEGLAFNSSLSYRNISNNTNLGWRRGNVLKVLCQDGRLPTYDDDNAVIGFKSNAYHTGYYCEGFGYPNFGEHTHRYNTRWYSETVNNNVVASTDPWLSDSRYYNVWIR